MIVTTHEDYSPSGTTRYELADDGSVTVTDPKGATVVVPPTPETAATAAQIVASQQAEAEAAARQARLDALLAIDPAVLDAAVKSTAAIESALVTKGVLTAKDITDATAVVAVEPVAEVKPG